MQRSASALLLLFLVIALPVRSSATVPNGRWQDITPILEDQPFDLQSLVFDPKDPQMIYGRSWGAYGIGVRSVDRGSSWSPLSESPTPFYSELAIDPTGSGVAYSWAGRLLFRSEDGGRSWSDVELPFPAVVRWLVMARNGKLFIVLSNPASQGARSIWTSGNGGSTWSRITGDSLSLPFALHVVGDRSGNSLLGVRPGPEGRSTLAQSEDGGRSWTAVLARFGGLAVDPQKPNEVWALQHDDAHPSVRSWTLRQSSDNGRGWSAGHRIPFEVGSADKLAVSADGTLLYPSPAGALHRSTDEGRSWTKLPLPTFARREFTVAASPGDPNLVFVYSGRGLLRSEDGGKSFAAVMQGARAQPFDLAAAPDDPDLLVTDRFRSRDGGVTWQRTEDETRYLDDIAGLGNEVFVAMESFTRPIVSRDGGETWRSVAPPELDHGWAWGALTVGFDPRADPLADDSRSLYWLTLLEQPTGLPERSALFRSRDLGDSWELLGELGYARYNTVLALDVVVEEAEERALVLLRQTDAWGFPVAIHLLGSRDSGRSWQELPLPAESVWFEDARYLPGSTDSILLAGPGLFQTSDRGETWRELFEGASVRDIAIDERAPERWYVAASGSGIWETRNAGGQWQRLPGRPISVFSLHLDAAANRLFVSSTGLYRYRFEDQDCDATASDHLCLNERFRVEARFRTEETSGVAGSLSMTRDSGALWFFRPDNVELVVKVLDACAINDRYWVFVAGLTNVEVELTVEDVLSEERYSVVNSLGAPFSPITDVGALASCP